MRQPPLTVSQMDLLLQIIIHHGYRNIPACEGNKDGDIKILQQRKLVEFTGLDTMDYRISEEGSRVIDLMKAVTGVR